MSIDIDRFLTETATKVEITYNQDGDKVWGATSEVDCLYRDISTLSHGANRDEVDIDGFLWFGAAESVEKGDIYYHPSEGYLEIVRITKAKRLVTVGDQTVKFIKTEVQKTRQIS